MPDRLFAIAHGAICIVSERRDIVEPNFAVGALANSFKLSNSLRNPLQNGTARTRIASRS
jgi:hypothetical protein